MPGHVHHAVAHGSSGKHTDGCHQDDGLELGHLGSDGRIEEIHRVIAHSDHKVEHGKDDKERYDSEKKRIHIVLFNG